MSATSPSVTSAMHPDFEWSTEGGLWCCAVTYPKPQAQTLTVCYTAKPDNPALTGYRLIRRLQRFTRKETT